MLTSEGQRQKALKRDAERQRNRPRPPAKNRENWLKFSHDISPEERAAMREDQGGRCCYCERPLPEDPRKVHLDHNHACACGPRRTCRYCRRGLACSNCNLVLGLVADDPDRLDLIAANFRRLHAESNARLNGCPVQIELITLALVPPRSPRHRP